MGDRARAIRPGPGIDFAGTALSFEVPETTLTDPLGAYAFTSLDSGTYEVREIVQPGYIQTAPGGDGTYSVTLATGES